LVALPEGHLKRGCLLNLRGHRRLLCAKVLLKLLGCGSARLLLPSHGSHVAIEEGKIVVLHHRVHWHVLAGLPWRHHGHHRPTEAPHLLLVNLILQLEQTSIDHLRLAGLLLECLQIAESSFDAEMSGVSLPKNVLNLRLVVVAIVDDLQGDSRAPL